MTVLPNFKSALTAAACMMSRMRLVAATFPAVLIAGCAGTTAVTPSTSPVATSTVSATTAPTASSATATQATTAAISCTAPAQALVELTEGPYFKAMPSLNVTLPTAGDAGSPLTL